MTNAKPILGQHALDGVKVIDLTRVLGGPYATQILADHGADVIKIESVAGDEVRGWGPPFARDMASYFINVNRNKKSVVIDLASVPGRDLLLRLLEDADVLIDNFKTGTLEKWGIGYEAVLKNRFPRLVHCRISGFGEAGPLGGAPGYDAVVQAMTGMMSINGMAESGPVRLGAPIVDMGTGLYCVIGILMALHERQNSGLGQYIDMTLYDSALALMHPHNANYFLSKKPGTATGNSHPNISPYDKYATATNDIFIGIGNNRAFRRFCDALGESEIADDPRFTDNADRVVNRAALTDLLTRHWPRLMARHLPKLCLLLVCQLGRFVILKKHYCIRKQPSAKWCLKKMIIRGWHHRLNSAGQAMSVWRVCRQCLANIRVRCLVRRGLMTLKLTA